MWLSRQMRREASAQEELRQSQVETAAGRIATREDQTLQLACPGGFAWRPKVGDRLLVLKDLALGAQQACPVELAPGECCLFTQSAYIRLTGSGQIELHGDVTLNGTPLAT